MLRKFTKVTLFPEEEQQILTRMDMMIEYYLQMGIDFDPIIYDAHEKMLTDADKRGKMRLWRNYHASNMSWNVSDTLYEQFPSFVDEDNEGRLYFRMAPHIRVYFKMLDYKYRPKNLPTEHVKRLNNSQQNLFDDKEDVVLYIGWRNRKDKYWDGLSGTYLVEMETNSRYKWVVNLSDLSAAMRGTTSLIPVMPVSPAPDSSVDEILRIDTGEERTGTLNE